MARRLRAPTLRLLLAMLGIAAAAVLVAGWLAEGSLRSRETARVEESLRERAALVREFVRDEAFEVAARERLQARAEQAARAAAARVTLIAADGTVIADSGAAPEELARLANHADRPEVSAALRGETGSDRRRSRTLGVPFLYVALPTEGGGAVRVAADLAGVEARSAELRSQILFTGCFAMALALALAFGISSFAVVPLRQLRRAVIAIAGGEFEARLTWRGPPDLREIVGLVAETVDGLRQRLREASEANEQLHAVLAGMVEGVLVVDRKERVVLANPRLRELFAVWGEVIGRPHWEVIRRPEVEEALGAAATTGDPVVLEIALGGPEEPVVQMHAVRFPKEGALRGIVAVFHEVTELRRLERIRREFVANVSHELKTPLTAIRGFAETLHDREVSPEQRRQYLQVILRHAGRLQALIEDVLDLSRVESRKLALEPDEIDVARVAATLLRDMGPQLESRELRTELVETGGGQAFADRRAVEQVLSNLLDNAAKYTERGGSVTVRVIGYAETVRVEVEDTGIGIPEVDLPRVFERFYRVDKARSRDLGGTGLGLAIVKHLVQSMGGDVFVSSRLGTGTTFAFTLPRTRVGSRSFSTLP